MEHTDGKTTQRWIKQTEYKDRRENSHTINISDCLTGVSRERWIKKYGRRDEKATMMKRDLVDIQVHFAKCNAERALLYVQEVPLFDISGIRLHAEEAPVMEGIEL